MSNCRVFQVPFVSSLTSGDTNSHILCSSTKCRLESNSPDDSLFFSFVMVRIKKCPVLKENNSELEAHIRHMLRYSIGSIIRCKNFAYISCLSAFSQRFREVLCLLTD